MRRRTREPSLLHDLGELAHDRVEDLVAVQGRRDGLRDPEHGGQVVVVIPELDLVVAGYGGSYAAPRGLLLANEYIPKYILPAVK